jgi:hypothetical protein
LANGRFRPERISIEANSGPRIVDPADRWPGYSPGA